MNQKKLFFIFFAIVFLSFVYLFSFNREEVSLVAPLEFEKVGTIGDIEISLTLADSVSKQTQGLSLQKELPENHGLLFIFESEGRHPIWMKDMLFSIDVLWFNEKKELVFVYENFSPESFPLAVDSPVPSLFVLEVPAGFVKERGVKIGDTLSF